jgi:integrase
MMSRRSKGDGSVFQTATGWRGYISLGGGRRKYASGKTRKECQAKLRQLQAEQQAGRDLGQPGQRVEQFLTTWLEQVIRRQRAEKTHHSYAQMCRLHLIPRIGHHRLDKLSPEHVQAMVNDIVDAGLSSRTADYARSILRAALSTAMRYGYVTRNVAALVEVPKGKKFEGQALTIDQARVFLGAVAGHRIEPLYRLTLALGLRQGEVINLTWENVDLEQSVLTIGVSKTGKRTIGNRDDRIALWYIGCRIGCSKIAGLAHPDATK